MKLFTCRYFFWLTKRHQKGVKRLRRLKYRIQFQRFRRWDHRRRLGVEFFVVIGSIQVKFEKRSNLNNPLNSELPKTGLICIPEFLLSKFEWLKVK